VGETALQRRVKRTEFILGLINPIPVVPPGPGPGTETAVAVNFTFMSGTMVLGVAAAGSKFNTEALLIQTAFDDPAATISFGTSGSPGLLLGVGDSKPGVAGQYQSDAIVVIPANDVLLLTVNPGASSQGAGLLFYKVLPP
jgi:hypothetical protein